jgi:hypothetical protein
VKVIMPPSLAPPVSVAEAVSLTPVLQLRAPQRDGPRHLDGVELDCVRAAGVERAADLAGDLGTEVGRQGGAVDEGDGLAQRQIGVAVAGGVEHAVDRQDRRGQAAFQRLQP